eukprot:79753-Pelagomonas_calceolata.AAC.4
MQLALMWEVARGVQGVIGGASLCDFIKRVGALPCSLRVERNGLRNAYGARKSECACVMKTGDEGGGTTKGLGGLHKPAQVCRADVISGQCALDCEPRDWSVT